MQVRDVMTANVISVPAQATILEAARTMLRNRVSGLPVVNANGQLVGMVTGRRFSPPQRGRHRAAATEMA
jgi:CBS domain-containing protein